MGKHRFWGNACRQRGEVMRGVGSGERNGKTPRMSLTFSILWLKACPFHLGNGLISDFGWKVDPRCISSADRINTPNSVRPSRKYRIG
jgi:hypothetical protein